MSKIPDVLNEYLVSIDFNPKEVPIEVYLSLHEDIKTKESREFIRRLWLIGNDYYYAFTTLMRSKGELYALFRPKQVTFDLRSNEIVLNTPSGLFLKLPFELVNEYSIEEVVDILNDYIIVKFKKGEYTVTDFTPLRANIDKDTAKEILEKIDGLTALTVGLGYEDNKLVKRLLLPRIVSWFKYLGRPLHVFQMTLPESGKTYFGIKSEVLFNYEYIPEAPTLARLVWDSRFHQLGTVFLRDGLVFDEFDKWISKRERIQEVMGVLLTGMEQGRWTRGISTAQMTTSGYRFIPVLIFSNILVTRLNGEDLRRVLTTRLSDLYDANMMPFVDRLALIDLCLHEIRISQYVTYKYLPDSVIRGIITLLNDELDVTDVSGLSGRLNKYSNGLYTVFTTLGVKVKPEDIDDLVLGRMLIDDIMDIHYEIEKITRVNVEEQYRRILETRVRKIKEMGIDKVSYYEFRDELVMDGVDIGVVDRIIHQYQSQYGYKVVGEQIVFREVKPNEHV